MQNDVEFVGPVVGYIQFMVYTDVNRTTAEPLGDHIWVNMKTLMGKHYEYKTKHSIAWPALSDAFDYVVANIPLIGYVDHPDHPDKVLRRMVYLVRSEVWPLLETLTADMITKRTFPE